MLTSPNPGRFLAALEHPADAFSNIGPNWFGSVMGTGIVANAAALLPIHVFGLQAVALAFWVLAAVWLIALSVATAIHWRRHPATARAHAMNPAMAPFYGTAPIALVTVGSGALLVGHTLLGSGAALATDTVLWSAGTALGLVVSVVIPYLMFTRHALRPDMTLGTWLLPIVPPLVSAAAGAALIPHLPAGQAQETMLLGCYALFGFSVVASAIVITLLWARLAYHGPGPSETVATVWIVLGPVGQSVTAINLLGARAAHVPGAHTLASAGPIYGAAVWGFGLLWLVIAPAITARAARCGMQFNLTWWSFTFPVGTMVTASAELARHTGLDAFTVAAGVLYLLLLAAWATAAVHTARGVFSGRLLTPRPSGLPANARTVRPVPAARAGSDAAPETVG